MSSPGTTHARHLLTETMRQMAEENPRGDLYRTFPLEKLLRGLRQNVDEIELALKYNNDVTDKIGDAANYLSFMLHNYESPTPRAEGTYGPIDANVRKDSV